MNRTKQPKNARIDSLLSHIGVFRISKGRFNDLGQNAIERIQHLVGKFSLLDWLTAIFHAAKNRDVEFGGKSIEADRETTITLNSLAVTGSIALAELKSIEQPLKNSNDKLSAFKQLCYCSLCYNDETSTGPATETDEKSIISNGLVPSKYTQAKYRVPPKFHLSRIYSWYCNIPDVKQLSIPPELDQYTVNEYGVGMKDFAQCIFLLWALSETRMPLIWSGSFKNIGNWVGSPTQQFLEKYSRRISDYTEIWALKPSTPDIQSGIPLLCAYPIVNLGEGIYSLPIPKLLYTHVEDMFYWKCFDYFKKKEGHADNTFTNWFGKIFEEYCLELLSSISKGKYFHDLRHLQDSKTPSLDAAEILPDVATFFEFKNRRLHRENSLLWSSESESKSKAIGDEVVEQILRFSRILPSHQELFNAKIKRVQFVVVTPYHLNINPFIQQAGWYKDALQSIQQTLSLSTPPELLFINQFDLEEWGKGRKTGGIKLGNYISEYLKSTHYPYVDFVDWIGDAHPYLSCNPAVDKNLESVFKKIQADCIFES